MQHRRGIFENFARLATHWSGSSWAFILAMLSVLVWLATGPMFHFSDTWQLVINTGTTIVTFLMVFLIQRAQNIDSQAIQLKLNELVAAVKGASNRLIGIEDLSEDDLRALHQHFQGLIEKARRERRNTNAHTIEETLRQPKNRSDSQTKSGAP